MKDLGHAHHIIGMRIREKRQKKLLVLPQGKCIEKQLDRFHMADALSFPIPLQLQEKLPNSDCPTTNAASEEMRTVPYDLACKKLTHAMVGCSDIAHLVGRTSEQIHVFNMNGKFGLQSSPYSGIFTELIESAYAIVKGFGISTATVTLI